MSTAANPSTTAPRLLPVDDDRDTGGFFEAARRHQLAIKVCDQCGQVLHMPRAYCRACGSWSSSWVPVAGSGRVYSWTVVEHQVHPAYPVPYTIVLVELEDRPGVRLIGHLPGAPSLREGQPMRVRFEDAGDDVVLPQWELTT
jgi:uncharacterized OB-fold protein